MSFIKKGYLILYNVACCLGWAYVLYLLAQSVDPQMGEQLAKCRTWNCFRMLLDRQAARTWPVVGDVLKIVQTAAVMEIVHAAIGLVPSPLVPTAMQVFSRLGLLWCFTNTSRLCYEHWSMLLMVTSWALVEVPRYFFYAASLVGFVPGLLFWLRYNQYRILYPTGITGEMLQVWWALGALRRTCVPCWYLSWLLLVLYLPGGPFMYNHMHRQRRAATKKRALASNPASAPPPPRGVQWPVDSKGERSTTKVNIAAFRTAAAALGTHGEALVKRIDRAARKWRFGYAPLVSQLVAATVDSTDKEAVASAEAGLAFLYRTFTFIAPDGEEVPLDRIASGTRKPASPIRSVVIEGTSDVAAAFSVPYVPYNGTATGKPVALSGKSLDALLLKWQDKGCIEADAVDAIRNVAARTSVDGGWLPPTTHHFCLLGAGSAMGPVHPLLQHGATVIAVDISLPHVWTRLIKAARAAPKGTRLIVPVRADVKASDPDDVIAAAAGVNMMEEPEAVAEWVLQQKSSKPLCVGAYAYLDGARHVQVALAMDLIMSKVCAAEPSTALAFLCTPTDAHVITPEARDAVKKNLAKAPLYQRLMATLGSLKPNLGPSARGLPIVDGIVSEQGPNYALAKRMQHWRAVVARSRGHTVSSNIAPSTATISVIHNANFAAAYMGFSSFAAMEVMVQETSSAMMFGLLISDLCDVRSASHAATQLEHPYALFGKTGFHGGAWRNPYSMGSIGVTAVLVFYARKFRVPLVLVTIFFNIYMGLLLSGVVRPPHKLPVPSIVKTRF